MASIPQADLFAWDQIETQSDLDRLDMVLDALPDEPLMRALEARRIGYRDDYPIRAVWNAIIAGIVFQHRSVESLRRELARNPALCHRCGLHLCKNQMVPPPRVFSELLKRLYNHSELIEAMFDTLVEQVRGTLPDFGKRLAIDGKAIPSFGRPPGEDNASQPDGRRDTDADWGVKTYRGTRKDGSAWEKTTRWFGYKLHLIVDADYELPVSFDLTKASVPDTLMLPGLVDELDQRHPGLLDETQYLSADKGYDAQDHHRLLLDDFEIRPIIDKRNDWQQQPHLPRQLFGHRVDTIFYNVRGDILCRCRDDGKSEIDNYQPMAYQGYEKDRRTCKYRCPAKANGIICTQQHLCHGPHTEHGRIVRVEIDQDLRTFCPLPRHTKTWKTEYNHRTAVERVNGRIECDFGFERHTIRGQDKMRLRTGLALVIMLALAVGWLKRGQGDNLRSLVKRPAA